MKTSRSRVTTTPVVLVSSTVKVKNGYEVHWSITLGTTRCLLTRVWESPLYLLGSKVT